MARAKIELMDSLSHAGRGRTFRRGYPQILTNAGDIQYYLSHPSYNVQMLDTAPAKRAVPSDPDSGSKEGGEVAPPVYTRSKLEALKKVELMDMAAEMGILLEGDELKVDMIDTIIEGPTTDDDEEDEDDDEEDEDDGEEDEDDGEEDEDDGEEDEDDGEEDDE